MHPFRYTTSPGRVLFGTGMIAELGQEAERLGVTRALLISTRDRSHHAGRAAELLGERLAFHFDGAAMHTPLAVTEKAMAVVAEFGVNGLVAIGGGSATGLSKAIAVRTGLPQIILPTTYAGSEMTPILGETHLGQKTTRSDPAILPQTVLYDPELTLSLPAAISGTSGMNAIAHAVEALYARDRNPITSLLAIEAIGALRRALPLVVEQPEDIEARSDALYGAWLCGICLGSVGMALHHKLCHTLGGLFDLPHAALHTAILPHALAYNAPAIPEAMARLDQTLGGWAPQSLFDLARSVGATTALRDLGMPQDGIGRAIESALANPYWNPRDLESDAIGDLLNRAWAGDAPSTP